jgi:hypothetical protein
LAALVVAAGVAGVTPASRAQGAGDGPVYLPLAVGHRWELRSGSAPDPMVLEVTGRDGNAFVVRWINPFVQATFRFESDGTRIVLAGLDMGQGNARMPANTVYWDFGRAKGETWKSPIGSGEIADRGGRVQTPAGEYRDTVEVRTIDQKGQSMYWTFAAGVGLVRWGRGRDAFLLSSLRSGGPSADVRPETRGAPPARTVRRADPASRVLIGLDADPHEKTGYGKRGKLNALQQAFDAGMSLLHVAPTWESFEKSSGRFDLSGDAEAIGEFAQEHDLPIALNLRIVDTNRRSIPKPYAGWRFDDERLADRLRAALRAFPAAYKRHTRLLALGNEVDGYLSQHRDEIAGYAELIRGVAPTAHEEFPHAQLTVNFTFGAAADYARYGAIARLTDFASFTYYPLNADFTMRPVSDLRPDVDRMIEAAGDRRLYIQEIGYASAERLHSSPRQQADFYATAFDILGDRSDRIIGATFLFMSDLAQSVVDSLGGYYQLANSANFKAYLQTLGVLEQSGAPKPAWTVFRREALSMRGGR